MSSLPFVEVAERLFKVGDAFEEGAEACFATIYNRLYPHKPIPDSYAAWRFRDTPAASSLLVIRKDGGVVGFHGANRIPMAGGGSGWAWLALDALVLPEHQGHGAILVTTARFEDFAVADKADWILAFCNRRMVPILERGFGWRCLANLPIWEKAKLGGDRGADARWEEAPSVAAVANHLEAAAARRAALAGPGGLVFGRTAAGLSWRLDRNPYRRYTALVWRRGDGSPLGVAIVKAYRASAEGPRSADVVEWATETQVSPVELLTSLEAHLAAGGFHGISLWESPLELPQEVLESLGYSRSAAAHFLMGKALGGASSERHVLRMCDAEMF